ncbi:MAG: hypothetical protein AAFZ52_05890 [Bacteroidota bacterium]
MYKLYLTALLSVVLLAGACKEEILAPRDLSADYAYYPLEIGTSNFYRMDSIVLFNTVQGVVYDTITAEVRETLVESFVDADGTIVFRGERWQRPDAASPWHFVQTYTAHRNERTAVRSEDNLSFTKLVFPLRENVRWDGNAAFDDNRPFVIGGGFVTVYRGWSYRYLEVREPVSLDTGIELPEAVYVEQDTSANNFIERRLAYERYAPGIGRIERFIDARDTQCVVCCNQTNTDLCATLPWDEKAEEGFILRELFVRRE